MNGTTESCCNKGKVFVAIGVGILCGMCLLTGMMLVVRMAVRPLKKDIQQIAQAQQRIEKTLEEFKKAARQDEEPEEDLNKVYDIPVGSSLVIGKADAPVTIVEFSDLQCPFCARFHPAAADVVKQFPDKVKLVLKNFPLPFHAMAKPAARAVMAAGSQGKAVDMLNLVLTHQGELAPAKFEEWAGSLGLDVAKFKEEVAARSAEWDAQINADIELGRKVDVPGTPTFFLNGKKTMARAPAQWKEEVEALLKVK